MIGGCLLRQWYFSTSEDWIFRSTDTDNIFVYVQITNNLLNVLCEFSQMKHQMHLDGEADVDDSRSRNESDLGGDNEQDADY